ncbi:hypothetical protein ACQE3D_10660 [Methylomonas sp. MS20]|uniref:hypothetical protein n=1 Tax=unclassified Methylomonas TaxID=2608980 RepID=UPI0028A38F51|nr:hypothetical protein [Methylomonas sp. MV1]MDT4328542.1 hypothetical protein [Methylomonas sp. MV1]
MSGKPRRAEWEFDTESDFLALGGPAAYGDGRLAIGGIEHSNRSGLLVSRQAGRMLTFVTLGDSRAGNTQGYLVTAADKVDAPLPASGTATYNRALQRLVLPALYPGLKQVANCGTSGITLETFISNEAGARSATTKTLQDAVALNPDFIIDRMGINSIAGVIDDATYAAVWTNRKAVIDWEATVGIPVFFNAEQGFSEGLPGFAANANGDLIRSYVIRFIRDTQAYIDGLHAVGKAKNIYFLQSIGVTADTTGAWIEGLGAKELAGAGAGRHPTFYGGYATALPELALLRRLYGESKPYAFEGDNKFSNGLFLNYALSGSTGNVATNVAISSTNCTRQNADLITLDGKRWQVCEGLVTATGQASLQFQVLFNPTATGTDALNMAAGDIYGFELDMFVENLTTGKVAGLSTCRYRVRTFDAANSKSINCDLDTINNSNAPATVSLPGRIQMHMTHKQRFQESAAAYSGGVLNNFTSSHILMLIDQYAEIGQVIRCGIANPRIVKLSA